jgi:hypothetical protein
VVDVTDEKKGIFALGVADERQTIIDLENGKEAEREAQKILENEKEIEACVETHAAKGAGSFI